MRVSTPRIMALGSFPEHMNVSDEDVANNSANGARLDLLTLLTGGSFDISRCKLYVNRTARELGPFHHHRV